MGKNTTGAMKYLPEKSTLEIFRDCLKLVPRMVTERPKINAVRILIKREFEKNKTEADAEKIDSLRFNAIRGISNYLIFMVKEEYKSKPPQQIFQQDENEEEEEER